eukprot:6481416-Amphidinium_carterae.1
MRIGNRACRPPLLEQSTQETQSVQRVSAAAKSGQFRCVHDFFVLLALQMYMWALAAAYRLGIAQQGECQGAHLLLIKSFNECCPAGAGLQKVLCRHS